MNADLLARQCPRAAVRAACLNNFFFPNQQDCNPFRKKPWISISKEKGEWPLHAPLTLPTLLYTVLVALVTPWAECRSVEPTKQTLVSPHNSPWWWLTLLFMERAGGSYNTLQIIAHPRSFLYSPSLTPLQIFTSSFLPFLTHSLFLQLNVHICE